MKNIILTSLLISCSTFSMKQTKEYDRNLNIRDLAMCIMTCQNIITDISVSRTAFAQANWKLSLARNHPLYPEAIVYIEDNNNFFSPNSDEKDE